MAEVPDLVTNWRKVVWTVISSIRENADRVAAKIQRDNHPDEPEGTHVRTEYLARANALERKLDTLEARARAVLGERGDNAAILETRDDATTLLRGRILRTRSYAEGSYDPATLAQLGLTGETPRDPVALLTYAGNAAAQLREVAPPSDEDEDEGVTFDPVRRAELIEEGIARLKAATEAVAQDAREDQTALDARNRAEEDLRYCYIAAADLFTADAIAGGYREIADRVRTTHRRREGIPEPTDVDAGPTSDPDPTLVTGDPTSEG